MDDAQKANLRKFMARLTSASDELLAIMCDSFRENADKVPDAAEFLIALEEKLRRLSVDIAGTEHENDDFTLASPIPTMLMFSRLMLLGLSQVSGTLAKQMEEEGETV